MLFSGLLQWNDNGKPNFNRSVLNFGMRASVKIDARTLVHSLWGSNEAFLERACLLDREVKGFKCRKLI